MKNTKLLLAIFVFAIIAIPILPIGSIMEKRNEWVEVCVKNPNFVMPTTDGWGCLV